MSFLALVWFCLAAFLLAVYAVLDGFDLGAGIVYGFSKDKARKERILAAALAHARRPVPSTLTLRGRGGS